MFINVVCNSCGALMNYDDTKEHMFCWSCGQKILRLSVIAAVSQAAQAAPRPHAPGSSASNVAVTYDSSSPDVRMTITMDDGSGPVPFTSGKTKKFHLDPGRHSIFFVIGNRSYRRNIDIMPGNAAYKIECGWCDGRAYISILQPSGGIIGT